MRTKGHAVDEGSRPHEKKKDEVMRTKGHAVDEGSRPHEKKNEKAIYREE